MDTEKQYLNYMIFLKDRLAFRLHTGSSASFKQRLKQLDKYNEEISKTIKSLKGSK